MPKELRIRHKNTTLSVNARNERIFLTVKKGDNTITIMLNAGEALALSQYLTSIVNSMLENGLTLTSLGKASSSSNNNNNASKTSRRNEEVTAPKNVEDVE